MIEEIRKNLWLWILGIALTLFLVVYLACYFAFSAVTHKMHCPMYNLKRMEKMLAKQENRFENYEDRMMENPFQPRLRPMLVNLVRENGEYRVIVDLKPFDGETNGINVNVEGNVLSVSGELDKKFHGNEKIINFRQAYFLDDKLEVDKMTKEKKGDKYIITIPVED